MQTELTSTLERAARELAKRHQLSPREPQKIPVWQKIDETTSWLSHARQACINAPSEASKAAEWLLDNDFQIYRAIKQVKEDLPTAFHNNLPALQEIGQPGFPRIFAIAHELLRATHLQMSLPAAISFIATYQQSSPLTIAELWAFPVMLRMACLEIMVPAMTTLLDADLILPFKPTEGAAVLHSLDETERVARSIANLSLIAAISWEDFFDQTSEVERILRHDPSGYYARMDFETRDHYRRRVEEIASYSEITEIEVADESVKQSKACSPDQAGHHLGHWLTGEGRPAFQENLGLRLPLAERLRCKAIACANFLYPAALILFLLGALALPAAYLSVITNAGAIEWLVTLLIMAFPASIIATSTVQWLVTTIVPPKILSKLDFSKGLPADCKTIVVIPVLVGRPDEVEGLMDQMDMHWLANNDPHLQIGLLADLADAATEQTPLDDAIIDHLISCVETLNQKHGGLSLDPFHLLLRPRQYNSAEGCWMAWERKRGKLEQFNQLLIEGNDSAFSHHIGNRAALEHIRFVVTVDADTILPTGSVAQLAATLAHPQNSARFDQQSGRVVSGYSIVQPRVEMGPQQAGRTLFNRFFAGDTAIDIYSHAVSNVYQDLFGSGIFVGKGIYDVAAFHRSIDGRVRENTILSHDLLEGALGRVALASDIVLYEGYPERYPDYIKRWHRWVRGDWQLLPWLRLRVRGKDGKILENPLSALDKWKINDNLRRSLVPPSLLLMVVIGWLFLPGSPWFWTALAVFANASQLFTDLVTGLATGRRQGAVRGWLAQQVDQSGRWLLSVVFLPYESTIALHAIGLSLWRQTVSHKHRLQWTPAAQQAAQGRANNSRVSIWHQMRSGPVIAVVTAGALFLIAPSSLPAATPILLLWFLAPEISLWLERPRHKVPTPLNNEDVHFLRQLARRTWLYFETFAGPQDNWLPPDNYQGAPHEEIAHRTSPTNIGMLLLASGTAWDLGYLGAQELAARTSNIFDTLDRLQTYRGHLLNWYDTVSLEPLEPRYVSVVDSGNLAGCLVAHAELLKEISQPDGVEWQRRSGLGDVVGLFSDAIGSLKVSDDELDNGLHRLQLSLSSLSENPSEWHPGLQEMFDQHLPSIERAIGTLAAAGSIPTSMLREIHSWLDRFHHQLKTMLQDIEFLTPWLKLTDTPAPLEQTFARITDLLDANANSARFYEAITILGDVSSTNAKERSWLAKLQNAIETANTNQTQLAQQLAQLSGRAGQIAEQMDFTPFYDADRRLFYIGYNTSADRMDPHHYDLLASEARLASYFAIAHQHVPVEHWFHLGRPVMRSREGLTLISWNGSMFEYLMPRLLMSSAPQTLLYESERVAVEIQQQYGKERGTPWGVSESAYADRDPGNRYQYQAFGVPGLGLKRGLAKDLVIAPYASALALQVAPADAAANLRIIMDAGYCGLFGVFDAVDFTRERLIDNNSVMPVNAYMAHHQGMIICAIGNSLLDDILVRRFERDPRMRAISLLLNERIPNELPSEVERIESRDFAGRAATFSTAPHCWQPPLETHNPQMHLLGNGSISSWISAAGGGGLKWRKNALTRFHADPTRDADGMWIYLHDEETDNLWSATRQPTLQPPEEYDVTFHSHMATFHRRDHDISARMEVGISAGDDIEIRRLSLTNLSEHPRKLTLTSYGEIVLAPPLEDERHPAFSKLFVHSEYIAAVGGLLFYRNPRSPADTPPVMLHFLVHDGASHSPTGHETDRCRFIGRNGQLSSPWGSRHDLSGTTGWTLDPVMSLQVKCHLGGYESTELCFVTIAAASREAALEIAERYSTVPSLEWAINDAASACVLESERLGFDRETLAEMQQIASLLIYPHGRLASNAAKRRANQLGQTDLWGMAISGDYPILLLKTGPGQEKLLPKLIRAQQLWRRQGMEFDLVVLQTAASGYIEPVREELTDLLQDLGGQSMLGRNGGIHLLFNDQIGSDQLHLLEAVARVVIDEADGPLAAQLAAAFQSPSALPFFEPSGPPQAETAVENLERPIDLLFDNGLGGFTPDGREYLIHLEPEDRTPTPWVNILANDSFGCVVTEAGGGFSWAQNSGENRITPWTNDPVSDEPTEILYLRDEQSAEIWTTTPGPAGRETACQIRHGAGFTEWKKHSHGLDQELRIFVPVDDPVKLIRLKLRNPGAVDRRITATYYAEWLLGSLPSLSRSTVVCDYEPHHHAIFARNSWNPEFAGKVAFLTSNRQPHGMTMDRRAFFGREGNLEKPAGLTRWGFDTSSGSGTDPCGVYQVHVDLAPGATEEILFVVGQGENKDHAIQLVAEWQMAGRVEAAYKRVKEHWNSLLGTTEVHTPDPGFDVMVNRWLLYQSMSSRLLARAGFYQASGAIGFRDQLQDVLAFLHNDPERARAHILSCAAHQFEEGDVLHWWHPPGDRGVRTRCSDDLLWLVYAVCQYIETTGDQDILDEKIPFLCAPPLTDEEGDRYSAFEAGPDTHSLLEHCQRALKKGLTRGSHGLPLIGAGDWNDGMDRVGERGKGESIWLAWFIIVIATDFAKLMREIGCEELAENWEKQATVLRSLTEESGWDGDWYLRAFDDEGHRLGSAVNNECRIDSISQSWALFAGADAQRTAIALDSAYRELVSSEWGIAKLLSPPFENTPRDPGYIKAYPPGIRENGGQYSHAAAWLGIAFSRAGAPERAIEIFNMLNPVKRTENVDQLNQYRVEPYVVAADIAGGQQHGGRGGWTWYTGAAAWTWRLAVEEILGLRQRGTTLHLDPCLPGEWSGFTAIIRRAGGAINLTVEVSEEIRAGQHKLVVDGKSIAGTNVEFPDNGTIRDVILQVSRSKKSNAARSVKRSTFEAGPP